MSNLYANRVFGEHPIALWSFDEEAHYVSQINDTDRDLTNWTGVNAVVANAANELSSTPFPLSTTFTVVPGSPETVDEITLTSPVISFSRGTEPLYSSFYIYLNYASVEYIDFGSTDGLGNFSLQRNYMPTVGEDFWAFVSNANIVYDQLYIKIKFYTISDDTDPELLNRVTYLINGLAVGDYSEPFSSESLGIELEDISASDLVTQNSFVTDNPYSISGYSSLSVGSKSQPIYYLAEGNTILAQNTGMPLAFGSNYLTKIKPCSDSSVPSLVFDGDGFLVENGRYDTYTLEFWMRMSDVPSVPKRIFGPLGNKTGTADQSKDGLWITNTVMSFVVGNKAVLSYNVGILSDPMLIHLVYTPSNISMLINGDIVATKNIDSLDLTFAEVDNKWLGFWGSTEINTIEIDCMSLFGYSINELLARRRFVWGQGVSDIGVINNSFGGNGVVADFSKSLMTSNASYPNNYIWEAGTFDNLRVVDNRLQPQETSFPKINLGGMSKELWLSAMGANTGLPHFVLNPISQVFEEQDCYVEFENIGSFVQNPIGLTVTWSNEGIDDSLTTWDEFAYDYYYWSEFDDYVAEQQYEDVVGISIPDSPVFVIRNSSLPSQLIKGYVSSGSTFIIEFVNGESRTIIHENTFDSTKRYSTLINFSNAKDYEDNVLSSEIRNFISNTNALNVIIGSDGEKKFYGKIFHVGLITNENYLNSIKQEVSSTTRFVFNSERVEDDELSSLDLCSYSWLPKNDYGFLYDDIGIKGYWQDYVSLEQMAGVVTDQFGDIKTSVDNIQFNIGVSPSQEKMLYSFLSFEYSTYAELNSAFLMYDELKSRVLLEENENTIDDAPIYYRTRTSFIKSFVSFQKSSSRIKQKNELELANAITSDAIYVQDEDNFINKYFEVVDGSVLVPPKNIKPENVIMSTYLEFSIPGINTYPVTLRNMEISAFAKNQDRLTPIGSKYGKEVYPIVTNSAYYDYYSPNPFKISKKSFPHFFLGKETGFVNKAKRYNGWESGFQISLNEVAQNSEYKFDNIQMWCRRNEPFNSDEHTVFTFEYGTTKKIFTLQAYNGNSARGIINVYNEDGTPDTEISFHQNGNIVYRPVFNAHEWTDIQAAFPAGGLNTGSFIPQIKFLQGLVFNNVSYFPTKPTFGSLSFTYRTWDQVLENESEVAYAWTDWKDATTNNEPYTWQNVLVKGTSASKTVDLSQVVYKSYIGIQSISIEGKQPMRLSQGEINSYREIDWSISPVTPT